MERLADITTLWTVVRQAHGSAADGVAVAQQALMERYSGAVYRYLLGALRDRDAADDLFQEFALRFVRGDFRNANPDKGRFRDFVKTSLFHLIVDYQKRQKGKGKVVPLQDCPEQVAPQNTPQDLAFLESWRDEILSRTWNALEEASRSGEQAYYTVLRFRAQHPKLSSQEMAERLSTEMGRPLRSDWVRQTIRRAREKFGHLLLEELSCSLESPTRERLEEELVELELLSYCKDALDKFDPRHSSG